MQFLLLVQSVGLFGHNMATTIYRLWTWVTCREFISFYGLPGLCCLPTLLADWHEEQKNTCFWRASLEGMRKIRMLLWSSRTKNIPYQYSGRRCPPLNGRSVMQKLLGTAAKNNPSLEIPPVWSGFIRRPSQTGHSRWFKSLRICVISLKRF